MKIIILVDFNSQKFNQDFQLANKLLTYHKVLLVRTTEQLKSSIPFYDYLVVGFSAKTTDLSEYSIKLKSADEILDLM